MKNQVRMIFLGGALTLGSAPIAAADPNECREAVDHYNSALSDVSTALRQYTSCLADSRGHDDCSTEFQQLQSAQDDFETAVSEYESDCS